MRVDSVGLFWQDAETKKGDRAPRIMPPIPDTGWLPPTSFPNLSSAKCVSVDCETYDPELLTNGPGWARNRGHIVGVAIGADGGGRWYFPLRHEIEPDLNLDPVPVLAWLRDTLGNSHQPKVGANLMYDYGWLRQEGVIIKGDLVDVQYAEALLDERSHVSLEVLAQKYLGEGKVSNLLYQWCADFYGGKADGGQRANIYRAPARLVGPYAQGDADLPLRLATIMYPHLVREGMVDLFAMECALIPLLVEMRFAGVTIDIPGAEQLRDKIKAREEIEHAAIKQLAGVHVDINAADSLAKAFDALGIPYSKTAKGRPSFTKDFLAGVSHPIAKHLNEVRKLSKLRGTFLESYLLASHINGKVHGQFHPLRSDEGGTRSGRLSSCLPDTATIVTSSGEKALSEVHPGCYVLTHTGAYRKILNKLFSGCQQTYKIVLANGKAVTCTSNHRLMTSAGWLSIEDMHEHKFTSNTGQNIRRECYRHLFAERQADHRQCCGTNRINFPDNRLHSEIQPGSRSIQGREAPPCDVRSSWMDKGTGWVHRSPYRYRYNQLPDRQPGVAYFGGACTLAPAFSHIERIESMGISPVYDLEIETDHCFIADGIYVHNSTPNLQNLPVRDDELAPLVRGLFKPDPGHVLWHKLDYNQIEYRFLMHFAVGPGADEVRHIFNTAPNTDYHDMTRDLVHQQTGQLLQRRPIKNLNFGLIFGMGVDKVSHDLGLTVAKGRELFNAYHTGMPFVKKTMDACMEEARRTGIITTILGRKSRFDLWEPAGWGSEDVALPYEKAILRYGNLQRAYTHKALNRRLQGSAADLLKKAMLKCWQDGTFDTTGVPRLTVHDELDFSDPGTCPEAFREVRHIMETVVQLRIPVTAVVETGPDWGHTVRHTG